MKIYHYNPDNLEFIGVGTADENPVIRDTIAERAKRVFEQAENAKAYAEAAEGTVPVLPFPDAFDPDLLPELETEWMLPAHSTQLEAPKPPEGSNLWPFWAGTAWELRELPKPAPVEEPLTPEARAALETPTASPEQLAAFEEAQRKAKRDGLLAASDIVVLRAYEDGEPVPKAWKAYRKALRDITQQPNYPETINWPVAPE